MKWIKAKESNPFRLYEDEPGEPEKYNKKNQQTTKALIAAWEEFVSNVKSIQDRSGCGADDTDSRDAFIEWVKKRVSDKGVSDLM